MNLRTLLIDDEALARERLRGFLQADPTVDIIGECANGPEAITAIRLHEPDLIFLDMQMPGCNGLRVLDEIPAARRPLVVFATAHERFAVDAFDVAAVDYLLKPFDRDRLNQAMQRVRQARLAATSGLTATPPPTPGRPAPAGSSERIALKADGRLVFLEPSEIVRVEAADNYVVLHLTSGRLMVRETMNAIETRLGADAFARINRSAIVRQDQIRAIEPAQHGDYVVVLRDGQRMPLSRSLRGRLNQIFGGA